MSGVSGTYPAVYENNSAVYSSNLAIPIKTANFVQVTNETLPLNSPTTVSQHPVQIGQSQQLLTSEIYPKMYNSNDQNGVFLHVISNK